MHAHPWSLALMCWALLGLSDTTGPGQGGSVLDSAALYPAQSATHVVRFFGLDTDQPKTEELRAALVELGAELLYGPRTTQARPGQAFLAVKLPSDLEEKRLWPALRKGGARVKQLSCTAFDGRKDDDSAINVSGFAFTTRDFVMGISGKIYWFDSVGSWSQFYGEPGKLQAADIADRYAKLYGPFGGGTIGELVRERFAWELSAAPDAKQKERLLKAVRKLEGVVEAGIEGERTLALVVELSDVGESLPAGTLQARGDKPLDDAGLAAPRATWSTRPLWALLQAEKLAPRPAAEPAK